jgi:peptide/nickel transport system substrate-binding protein
MTNGRQLFRTTFLLALLFAALALAAGASAGQSPAKPTLVIGWPLCCFLNPMSGAFVDLSYEPLLWATSTGALRPGLATSWSVSPGNKAITMTLRTDARFSDGTPFTAQAVKTFLDYRRSLGAAVFDTGLGPIGGVDVLGKYRVRVRVESPNPQLALAFAGGGSGSSGFIASPRAVAAAKANPKASVLDKATFGAGQYVYDPSQSVSGDHGTWLPNKYYYDKSKIHWGKVVIKAITDPNSVLAAMKTGQIDVNTLSSATTVNAARAAGIGVLTQHLGFHGIYWWDHGGAQNKALANLQVRQALNYAINRPLISHGIYGPDAIPTANPVPSPIGVEDPKLAHYYTYDPAKAKALLAAAGYPNGFDLKLLTLGWDPGGLYEPFCKAVAQELQAVGVRAICDALQVDPFVSAWHSRSYDAFVGPNVNQSPWAFYTTALKPTKPGEQAIDDQWGWHDPVTDRLWLKAQRLPARQAAPLWHELVLRSVTQAYFVPIVRSPRYCFYLKRVGGVTGTIGGADPNSPTQWYPTGK